MKKKKKRGSGGGFVQNVWYDLITWEGILAKTPTGGLTRGEKKKIKSKNGKKNLLEDLPGGKKEN